MIIYIITLVIIIIGFLMYKKYYENECEWVSVIGCVLSLCGIVVAAIMTAIIISEHVGLDARIEESRIEYEALCERYEIVTSEYEDVSKSDVIKDIAEWNKNVYGYKYWTYNLWTNWFHSRRFADELKMIER